MGKISVLLSDAEEARFSAYCNERGHKKSTLIARLVREHLDREAYAAQPSLLEPAVKDREHRLPRRLGRGAAQR